MHLVVIGGSDAGISAALRARELDPNVEVTVLLADAYPNFSICGIPYLISREVGHWRDLAHRSLADLEATGLRLRLDTLATAIDVTGHRVQLCSSDGNSQSVSYDALVVATGAVPVVPPIDGLRGPDGLGRDEGVHLLHSMGDAFSLTETLERTDPRRALIVGAGYVGLEMADGLSRRGLAVVQVERLPEVLPTVDSELGALVRSKLEAKGIEVSTATAVTAIHRAPAGASGRLRIEGATSEGERRSWDVDVVLVSAGVRPETSLLTAAGAKTGVAEAVLVDEAMRTGLPDIYAAGDCVVTHHRLLGATYLPLGTTAHKQGRVAGENAVGGSAAFRGSLGTQVVKVFDLVAARTGLRDHETGGRFQPATVQSWADDHKAYYPGAHPIATRITGDIDSGRLLGAQLVGRLGSEIAKRIDIYATAIHHEMTVADLDELDLSYTPPLGSPWDVIQLAGQAWVRARRESTSSAQTAPTPGSDRPAAR